MRVKLDAVAVQTVMGVHDIPLGTNGRNHDAMLEGKLPFLPTVSGVNTWGYFSLYKGFITVLLLRVMLCGLLKSAIRARRTFWFAGLIFA